MSTVSDKPAWVVASYFLAWPWRRSAMTVAEQKVYLAQVAANGADPMVNLSGGPPAVHEDPRGFRAIRELYGFLDQHQAYYQDDQSAANVAILYSLETLRHAGQEGQAQAYVDELRGWQQALHDAHIPFDILSSAALTPARLAPYRVVVLPGTACLSDEQAQVLISFAASGGGLVGSYQVGLFTENGQPQRLTRLAGAVGVTSFGESFPVTASPHTGYTQVYGALAPDPAVRHPLLAGLEETQLVPVAGRYCRIEPASGAQVLQTLSAPFIVFPEGLSYPTVPASDSPLMVCHDQARSRSVYFASQIGQLTFNLRYPDHATLLANAVRWAAHDQLPIHVKASPGLQISLRRQPDRRLVHLINLAGTRLFAEAIPLHDITVSLPVEHDQQPVRAYLLSTSQDLVIQTSPGIIEVSVPKLVDYDVLVIETGG